MLDPCPPDRCPTLSKISPIIGVEINEPDANPLDEFLASIEKLRVIPDSVDILPSHNMPFKGLHARLDALHHHHDNRLNQFLDTYVRPMTAKELSDEVFPLGLDPQNVVFAIGETMAHLNYLCRHGSIVRERRDDGVYLYAHR